MAQTLPIIEPASPPQKDVPWDLVEAPRIAVMRPRLAPLAAILPHLATIDDRRVYSNFGPTNAELEGGLAARFGLPADCVVTCANGTLGLTLALQAAADGRRGLCLMPAWTFVATAHAAIAAGLTPYLVDVDPATGALTPEIARQAAATAPGDVVAVTPVAPYGAPIDHAAWDEFSAATRIPVVIDAAAGFDALKPGHAPSVVSLHATKVLGIGEGGFVVSRDPARIADLRRRANFGFNGTRNAELAGCNGKLSEYGAAVGLAALDFWSPMRAQYQAVLGYYRAALGDIPNIRLAEGLGESWVASTFNVEGAPELIQALEADLGARRIATRRWWGAGLRAHHAFRDLPHTDLPVTERLAAGTLGLPCWADIPEDMLREIADVVRATAARFV